MVLTSQAHRRCTPRTNRRIPTIPTGVLLGGWLVDVSAVDTGPRGSESGVLGGRARRRRGVEPPPQLSPTLRRLPRPAPATWVPSHVTNVMTSNIKLYLAPARRPGGHGSTPAPHRAGSAPLLPRVGLLHEGRDPLTTGCAYRTKAPPTRSTPNPPPVAPHPRAVHPDDAGSHHSNQGTPPTNRSSSSPIRQTHPTGVLRSHDSRNSQKS